MATKINDLVMNFRIEPDYSNLDNSALNRTMAQYGEEAKTAFKSSFGKPIDEALQSDTGEFSYVGSFLERQYVGIDTSLRAISKLLDRIDSPSTISEFNTHNIEQTRSAIDTHKILLQRSGANTDAVMSELERFISSDIKGGFAKELKNSRIKTTLKNASEGLVNDLISTATQIVKAEHFAGTDEHILGNFTGGTNLSLGSKSYQKLVHDLNTDIKNLERSEKMAKGFTSLMMKSGLPEYLRRETTGVSYAPIGMSGHAYNSFEASLPDSFKNINKSFDTITDLSSFSQQFKSSNKKLPYGISAQIHERVKTDRFLSDALKKIGALSTQSGRMKIAKDLTEKDMDLATGVLFKEMVDSAIGMEMYGLHSIDDLNNPDFWNRISRKGNKEYTGLKDSMWFLEDLYKGHNSVFGEKIRFNPTRMSDSDINAFRKIRANELKQNNRTNTFDFRHAMRQSRYEVPSYTFAEMALDDKDIPNWFGFQHPDPNIDNWEKYHHEPIESSQDIRKIIAKSSNPNIKHNGYINDMFIVKMPEFADYDSPEMQQMMQRVWRPKNIDGRTFNPVKFGRSGNLYFVEKGIDEAIRKEYGENYWYGISPETVFEGNAGFKKYVKTIESSTKNMTPGESAANVVGFNPAVIDPKRIVLYDGKRLTGLDGTTIMNTSLIGKGIGFQGRGNLIKNTTNSLYIKGLLEQLGHPEGVYVPGIDGGLEKVTGQTQILLSSDDIKNFEERYVEERGADGNVTKWKGGLTTDQVKELIAKNDFADYQVTRLDSSAHKHNQWISKQQAQTWSMTPEQRLMFTKEGLRRLSALNTVPGAIELVFGENSDEGRALRAASANGKENGLGLLYTPSYAARINEAREEILEHLSIGDLAVPQGVQTNSNMIAPWPLDPIIELIDLANEQLHPFTKKKIPDSIRRMMLGNDDNALIDMKAIQNGVSSMMVSRFPQSIGTTQVVNTGNLLSHAPSGKNATERIKAIAKFAGEIGLSPELVFLSPRSPLLDVEQTADFDGDVFNTIALEYMKGRGPKVIDDEEKRNIKNMADIAKNTMEDHRKTIAEYYADVLPKFNDEELELYNQGHKKEANQKFIKRTKIKSTTEDLSGTKFSLSGPEAAASISKYFALQQKAPKGMAAAAYTTANVFNSGLVGTMIATRAAVEADAIYDEASTAWKEAIDTEPTDDMYTFMNMKSPSRLFSVIKKSKGTDGQIDPEKLRTRLGTQMFEFGLPTSDMSPSELSGLTARFLAKKMYGSTHPGRKESLRELYEMAGYKENLGTAQGKLQAALLRLYEGLDEGEFILPGTADLQTLTKLSEAAQLEIENQIAAEGITDKKELSKRRHELWRKSGVQTVTNYNIHGRNEEAYSQTNLLASLASGVRSLVPVTKSNELLSDAHLNEIADKTIDQLAIDQANALRREQKEQETIKNSRAYALSMVSPETIARRLAGGTRDPRQDHPLTFSVTALENFAEGNEDAFDYLYKWFVDPTYKKEQTGAMSAGTAFHGAAQRYLTERQRALNAGKTEQEAHDLAYKIAMEGEDSTDPKRYKGYLADMAAITGKSVNTENTYNKKDINALQSHLRSAVVGAGRHIGNEIKVTWDNLANFEESLSNMGLLHDIQSLGFIDSLFGNENGAITAFDFKRYASVNPDDEKKFDFQVRSYLAKNARLHLTNAHISNLPNNVWYDEKGQAHEIKENQPISMQQLSSALAGRYVSEDEMNISGKIFNPLGSTSGKYSKAGPMVRDVEIEQVDSNTGKKINLVDENFKKMQDATQSIVDIILGGSITADKVNLITETAHNILGFGKGGNSEFITSPGSNSPNPSSSFSSSSSSGGNHPTSPSPSGGNPSSSSSSSGDNPPPNGPIDEINAQNGFIYHRTRNEVFDAMTARKAFEEAETEGEKILSRARKNVKYERRPDYNVFETEYERLGYGDLLRKIDATLYDENGEPRRNEFMEKQKAAVEQKSKQDRAAYVAYTYDSVEQSYKDLNTFFEQTGKAKLDSGPVAQYTKAFKGLDDQLKSVNEQYTGLLHRVEGATSEDNTSLRAQYDNALALRNTAAQALNDQNATLERASNDLIVAQQAYDAVKYKGKIPKNANAERLQRVNDAKAELDKAQAEYDKANEEQQKVYSEYLQRQTEFRDASKAYIPENARLQEITTLREQALESYNVQKDLYTKNIDAEIRNYSESMYMKQLGLDNYKPKKTVEERANEYITERMAGINTLKDLITTYKENGIDKSVIDALEKTLAAEQERYNRDTSEDAMTRYKNMLIGKDKIDNIKNEKIISRMLGKDTTQYDREIKSAEMRDAIRQEQIRILKENGATSFSNRDIRRAGRKGQILIGDTLQDVELSDYQREILGLDEDKINQLLQNREDLQKTKDSIQVANYQYMRNQQLQQYEQQIARSQMRQPRGAFMSGIYGVQMRKQGLLQQAQNYRSQRGQALNTARMIAYDKGLTKDTFVWNKEKQDWDIKDEKKAELLKQDEKYQKANIDARIFNTMAQDADKAAQSLTGLTGVAEGVHNVFSRLSSMFGRRIFMRLLSEVTTFMKQYDQAMTNIQMITLKTNDEMESVGDNNFDIAKRLKTDAVTVAQVKGGLYRQGLNDEEVEERTEQVIKFAKVAGIKTETASKIMTTALKNGLVQSAQEAMDVLAALGDSAATTADQIQQALQKVAATAHNTGTEYNELTALLTVALDKTQLSGNVVGTAMNTIMTRMRRVNESNYVKASNGEITTINDVDRALSRVGVHIMDESGKMKDTLQVLQELAHVWETIDSDMTKQNIVYAMAGRGAAATNTFYSIMEGLGENGGEEFDKALETANSAAGTVDEKYTAYLDSYTASLQELNNAIDSLGEGILSSGIAQFFVEFASGLTSTAGVITTVIALLTKMTTSALAASGVMKAATAGWIGLAAAGVVTGVSLISSAVQKHNEQKAAAAEAVEAYNNAKNEEKNQSIAEQKTALQTNQDRLDELFNKYKKYGDNYLKKMTKDELDDLTEIMEFFAKTFPDEFSNLNTILNNTGGNLEAFADLIEKIGEKTGIRQNELDLEQAQFNDALFKTGKRVKSIGDTEVLGEFNTIDATNQLMPAAAYYVSEEMIRALKQGHIFTDISYSPFWGNTANGHQHDVGLLVNFASGGWNDDIYQQKQKSGNFDASTHKIGLFNEETYSVDTYVNQYGIHPHTVWYALDEMSNDGDRDTMYNDYKSIVANHYRQLEDVYKRLRGFEPDTSTDVGIFEAAHRIGFANMIYDYVSQTNGLANYWMNLDTSKNTMDTLIKKLATEELYQAFYSGGDVDSIIKTQMQNIINQWEEPTEGVTKARDYRTSEIFLRDINGTQIKSWANGTSLNTIVNDILNDENDQFVITDSEGNKIISQDVLNYLKYEDNTSPFQTIGFENLIDDSYVYSKNAGYIGSLAKILAAANSAKQKGNVGTLGIDTWLTDNNVKDYVEQYLSSIQGTEIGDKIQRAYLSGDIDTFINTIKEQMQYATYESNNKFKANIKNYQAIKARNERIINGTYSDADLSDLEKELGYNVTYAERENAIARSNEANLKNYTNTLYEMSTRLEALVAAESVYMDVEQEDYLETEKFKGEDVELEKIKTYLSAGHNVKYNTGEGEQNLTLEAIDTEGFDWNQFANTEFTYEAQRQRNIYTEKAFNKYIQGEQVSDELKEVIGIIQDAGGTISFENGKITIKQNGIPVGTYINPLRSNEVYTPEFSRETAKGYYSLISGGATQEEVDKWLSDNRMREKILSSDWKDLVTYSNLLAKTDLTDEEQAHLSDLERKIKIQFELSGMQELEEAGQILEGMSADAQAISGPNKVKAKEIVEKQYNTFDSFARVNELYNMVANNQKLNDEQWTELANGLGISDIDAFKSGRRSLTSEYGSYISDKRDQIVKSLNYTAKTMMSKYYYSPSAKNGEYDIEKYAKDIYDIYPGLMQANIEKTKQQQKLQGDKKQLDILLLEKDALESELKEWHNSESALSNIIKTKEPEVESAKATYDEASAAAQTIQASITKNNEALESLTSQRSDLETELRKLHAEKTTEKTLLSQYPELNKKYGIKNSKYDAYIQSKNLYDQMGGDELYNTYMGYYEKYGDMDEDYIEARGWHVGTFYKKYLDLLDDKSETLKNEVVYKLWEQVDEINARYNENYGEDIDFYSPEVIDALSKELYAVWSQDNINTIVADVRHEAYEKYKKVSDAYVDQKKAYDFYQTLPEGFLDQHDDMASLFEEYEGLSSDYDKVFNECYETYESWLQNEIDIKVASIEEVQKELENLNADEPGYSQNAIELKTKYDDLNAELEGYKSTLVDVQSQIKSKQTEFDDKQSIFQSMSKTVKQDKDALNNTKELFTEAYKGYREQLPSWIDADEFYTFLMSPSLNIDNIETFMEKNMDKTKKPITKNGALTGFKIGDDFYAQLENGNYQQIVNGIGQGNILTYKEIFEKDAANQEYLKAMETFGYVMNDKGIFEYNADNITAENKHYITDFTSGIEHMKAAATIRTATTTSQDMQKTMRSLYKKLSVADSYEAFLNSLSQGEWQTMQNLIDNGEFNAEDISEYEFTSGNERKKYKVFSQESIAKRLFEQGYGIGEESYDINNEKVQNLIQDVINGRVGNVQALKGQADFDQIYSAASNIIGSDLIDAALRGTAVTDTQKKYLEKTYRQAQSQEALQYREYGQEAQELISALTSGRSSTRLQAITGQQTRATEQARAQWAFERFKAGDIYDQTIMGYLTNVTGYTAEELRDAYASGDFSGIQAAINASRNDLMLTITDGVKGVLTEAGVTSEDMLESIASNIGTMDLSEIETLVENAGGRLTDEAKSTITDLAKIYKLFIGNVSESAFRSFNEYFKEATDQSTKDRNLSNRIYNAALGKSSETIGSILASTDVSDTTWGNLLNDKVLGYALANYGNGFYNDAMIREITNANVFGAYSRGGLVTIGQHFFGEGLYNGNLSGQDFVEMYKKAQQGEEKELLDAWLKQNPEAQAIINAYNSEQDVELAMQEYRRKYYVDFIVSGDEQLEKAGKLLSGFSNKLSVILGADTVASEREKQGFYGELAEYNETMSLFERAKNGAQLESSDWDKIAKFGNVSDITEYIQDRSKLGKLQVGFDAYRTQAENSVDRLFASMQWSSTQEELQGFIDAARSLGFIINTESGTSTWNPETVDKVFNADTYDKAVSMGQLRRAIYNGTVGTGTMKEQRNAMYEIAKNAQDYEDFYTTIGWNTKAFNLYEQMLKNGELDEYIGDNGIVEDMERFTRYLGQQVGADYTIYDTVNEDVKRYKEALLSGDKASLTELRTLDNGDQIVSALRNYLGQEEYDRIVAAIDAGQGIDTEVLSHALENWQTSVYDEANVYNEYAADVKNLREQLTSDRASTRREAQQSYTNKLESLSLARWALTDEEYLTDSQKMSYIESATGLNEAQIRKKTREQLLAMVNETGNESIDILKDALKSGLEKKGVNLDWFTGDLLDFSALTEHIKAQNLGTELEEKALAFLRSIENMIPDEIKNPYQSFEDQYNTAFAQENRNAALLMDVYDTVISGSDYEIRQLINPTKKQLVFNKDGTPKLESGQPVYEEVPDEEKYKDYSYLLNNKRMAAWGLMQYKNGNIELSQLQDIMDEAVFGGNDDLFDREMLVDMGLGTPTNEDEWVEYKEHYEEAYRDSNQRPMLESLLGEYQQIGQIANAGSYKEALTYIESLNDEWAKADNVRKYGENWEAVTNTSKNFSKNMRTAVQQTGSMISKLNTLAYQNKQLDSAMGKSGQQLSNEESEVLAGIYGIDKKLLKDYGKDMIASLIEGAQENLGEDFSANIVDPLLQSIQDEVNGLDEDKRIHFKELVDVAMEGDGQVDASELAAIAAELNLACENALREFVGTGSELYAKWFGDGNKVGYELVMAALGKTGTKTGGGGGGGKSKLQKLLEEWKRKLAPTDHEIKMIQAEETMYKNRGELTNYNIMLEEENRAQERYKGTLREAIADIQAQMKTLKSGSDDWYAARDAIYQYCEAIKAADQAIEDNNRTIKENQQQILKYKSDIEDALRSEYENREKIRRDMLAGTVSMEDTILEAIRERYQNEWDLIKRDIDRKRQALEEEKNLINERLQARKDAEQEAEKYEQLAEYQRQLAYIEMDPTRTKDAAELRKKIAELEKELAWDTAEREAQAAQDVLDDEMQAYEQYANIGDEQLQNYLKDANNFVDDIEGLLESSFEDISAWLMANVESYKNALDAQQTQMLDSWRDTYYQMIHYVETYNDVIAETIAKGKDAWMQELYDSDEWKNATEAMRAQLEYQREEMWRLMEDSQLAYAEWEHSHEFPNGTGSSSGSGSGSGNKTTEETTANESENADHGYMFTFNGKKYKNSGFESQEAAIKSANVRIRNLADELLFAKPELYTQIKDIKDAATRSMKSYSLGGYADYTGLAMVHGSPTRPEAFLNADDTALVRAFLDAAHYISVNMGMSSIDEAMFGSSSNSIGEVNVTINEATISSDQDIEELASRVGESFTKQLSMSGFHTSNYSF